jgi:hypothetical protein
MQSGLSWYSINTKLETQSHTLPDAASAVGVAQKYYACARAQWPSAEECVAGTMFGFKNGSGASIEFCIIDAGKISCRFEGPDRRKSARTWLGRLRASGRRYRRTLRSCAEMEAMIVEFCAADGSGIPVGPSTNDNGTDARALLQA